MNAKVKDVKDSVSLETLVVKSDLQQYSKEHKYQKD